MSKIEFMADKTDCSIIDFGFYSDHEMFFIFNEEAHANVGMFMINFDGNNLVSGLKVKESGDSCMKIALHTENSTSECIEAEGYVLVNKPMGAVTISTAHVLFQQKL